MYLCCRHCILVTAILVKSVSFTYEISCKEDDLPTPDGGSKSCTNGKSIGSVCFFMCDQHFTIVGPVKSTCVETPNGPAWNLPPAVCIRDACSILESTGNGIYRSCTDRNFIKSTCSFKCTAPELVLYPDNVRTITCLPSTKWDHTTPCCTLPCPPNAKRDVYIVMDSSASVGIQNWNYMKAFIRKIVNSFVVSDDGTHFAAVGYSRAVDTSTKILLNDFREDIAALLEAIERIPYHGADTRTGQALSYVGSEMMRIENGNRPAFKDTIILITDGEAQDDVVAPARIIRNAGASIIAVGVRRAHPGELFEITGREDNVLMVESYESLEENILQIILEKICGETCEERAQI